MTTITVSQLKELLSSIKSATVLSLVAVTDARCRKTGNPFAILGPVYKVCRVNGVTGADWGMSVLRQQAREGVDLTYTVGDRSWGTLISGALVQKGNEFYLPIQLNPSAERHPIYVAPKLVGPKVRLLPVMPASIAPFLPSDRRAERAVQQNVSNPVERRDFKLTSIATLSILGERYRIRA